MSSSNVTSLTPPGPAILTTYVTAGEATLPGDLIVIHADGNAYYALPPGQPEAMFRPLNQPSEQVTNNALQTQVVLGLNANVTNSGYCQDSVALSDGNVALAYTANNFITIAIVDPSGDLIGSQQLGSIGPNTNLSITLLANDSVAVFFSTGTPPVLNVAVVDKNCNVVTATTTIDQSMGVGAISAATILGGNVAVGYIGGTNGNPKVQIVNPLGTIITAPFTVDTSTAAVTSSKSIAIVPLLAGGFAVAYAKTDGTTGSVFAGIYSGAGQLAGNLFQVGALYPSCPTGPLVFAAAMTGGGFGVAGYGGTGPGFALNIYNATGQIQGNNIILDVFDGSTAPNRVSMAGMNNGDLAVVWRNSTTAIGATFTPVGVQATPNVVFGAFSGAVKVKATSSGTIIAIQGAQFLNVITTDYTLNGAVTVTTVPRGQLNSIPILESTPTTLGDHATAMLAGSAQANVVFGIFDTFTIPQSTLIGVTPQGSGANQQLLVQFTGLVASRLPFDQPYSQDATGANPPGQKMSAIGNQVLLKGIQP